MKEFSNLFCKSAKAGDYKIRVVLPKEIMFRENELSNGWFIVTVRQPTEYLHGEGYNYKIKSNEKSDNNSVLIIFEDKIATDLSENLEVTLLV